MALRTDPQNMANALYLSRQCPMKILAQLLTFVLFMIIASGISTNVG
jgi:hypothetical protein